MAHDHSAHANAAPRRIWGTVLSACGILLLACVLSIGIAKFSTYAAVVTIAVGVGALVLWNPFIGLLVVVASLPFETVGMLGDPEATGAISVTKLGGLATFAAIIVNILLQRGRLDFSRLFNRISLLLLAFGCTLIVATALHPSEESVKESIRFITIIMFYFATLHLVDSRERLRRVVVTWVVVGFAVSIYSLAQHQFGGTVSSIDWAPTAATVVDVGESEVGTMVRAAGSFTHPIWLALYLSLTFPLTLFLIWSTRAALGRTLWCLAAFAQAIAIMATYARMGYMAMAMGVLLFLIRRRGGPAVVLWALLLAVSTSPFWPTTFKSRVGSILDYTKSSSSVTRIGQQLVALWMFRDHMISGVGPGNFEENVRDYVDRVPDKWRIEVIGAHNMYAEVLAEMGLQGLILALVIIFIAWRAAERARKSARDPTYALMYEAMAISVIVFAFCAFLIHAQYQKEWWLLLALISAAHWQTKITRQALPARPRRLA